MPNAGDIKLDTDASLLLVGDSGTHKTFFIGTGPSPIYVFDIDKGMSIHAGRKDIDYDTFKELPKGQTLEAAGKLKEDGWYVYGTAWPAFLAKLNAIGKSIDKGECKYKTIGVDSLTTLTDIAQSFILASNARTLMERQDWGAFLSNMTTVFSALTGWPLVKILTAHVKRDENLLSQTVEKLPLVPGQFAGKVPVLFDEVYYTNVDTTAAAKSGPGSTGKERTSNFWLQTTSDSVIKQAKSRKFNVPNGTPTTWQDVLKHIEASKKVSQAVSQAAS